MLANEYQRLAMRTCANTDDVDEMLAHGVFGLCSEAGEVAGLFQKVYQGHELDPESLFKELGDCLWMIAEICEAYDVTMGYIMQKNIDKLEDRYPNGFEVERSVHRKEYQV